MNLSDSLQLQNPPSYALQNNPHDPVILSSRARLARNLNGFYFPGMADSAMSRRTRERIRAALFDEPRFASFIHADIPQLSENDKMTLFERNLLSRHLLSGAESSGIAFSPDESTSFLINEEDHLRIQALTAGLDLKTALEKATSAERALEKELDFAFHPKYGYLTASPSNAGTALRASVMIHLPALASTEQMPSVERAAAKLSLSLRGMSGEKSAAVGNLFQISNQSMLGESEQQIIERLEEIVRHLAAEELAARERLRREQGPFLMNRVGRAFGVLKYAYTVKLEESLNALSFVCLGMDMGLLDTPGRAAWERLRFRVQPGHLEKNTPPEKRHLPPDVVRADMLREAFR